MFEIMLDEIDVETVRILFSIQFANEEVLEGLKKEKKEEVVLEKPEPIFTNSEKEVQSPIQNKESPKPPLIRDEPKLGRNEVVKVSNGDETKEMKYKKAKPLIESGDWKII